MLTLLHRWRSMGLWTSLTVPAWGCTSRVVLHYSYTMAIMAYTVDPTSRAVDDDIELHYTMTS